MAHRDPEKRAAYQKAYREKNRDAIRKSKKAYVQKNRDRLKQQHKEWARKNSERLNALHRAWHARMKVEEPEKLYQRGVPGWLKRYGLTVLDYEAMLEEQGNRCAICGECPDEGKKLHIDHDHLRGNVRALLCSHCNHALGMIRENPEIADALGRYLRYWRTKE
jgi:hypothetical protein